MNTSASNSYHSNMAIGGHRLPQPPTIRGHRSPREQTGVQAKEASKVYAGKITEGTEVAKQSQTSKTKDVGAFILSGHRMASAPADHSPPSPRAKLLSNQQLLTSKDFRAEVNKVRQEVSRSNSSLSSSASSLSTSSEGRRPLERSITGADLKAVLKNSLDSSKSSVEQPTQKSLELVAFETNELGPTLLLKEPKIEQPPPTLTTRQGTIEQNKVQQELLEQTKPLARETIQTIDNILDKVIEQGELAQLNGAFRYIKEANVPSDAYLERIIQKFRNPATENLQMKPGSIGVKAEAPKENAKEVKTTNSASSSSIGRFINRIKGQGSNVKAAGPSLKPQGPPPPPLEAPDVSRMRVLQLAKSFTWAEQEKISTSYSTTPELIEHLQELVRMGQSSPNPDLKAQAAILQKEIDTLTNKMNVLVEKKALCQNLYAHLNASKNEDRGQEILQTIAQLTTPKNVENYQQKLKDKMDELQNLTKNTQEGAIRMAHGFLGLAGKWSPSIENKADIAEISTRDNPKTISLKDIVSKDQQEFESIYSGTVEDMAQSWDAVSKNVFSKIQISEFHRQNWSSEEKSTLAPNLSALVNLINQATDFYTHSIISMETPIEQTRMIALTIDTAHTLMDTHQNLLCFQALFGILSNPKITNLPGMDAIKQNMELQTKLTNMTEITKTAGNMLNIRTLHAKALTEMQSSSSSATFIPSLDVYLKDLVVAAEVPTAPLTFKIGGEVQEIEQFVKHLAQQPQPSPSTDIVKQAIG